MSDRQGPRRIGCNSAGGIAAWALAPTGAGAVQHLAGLAASDQQSVAGIARRPMEDSDCRAQRSGGLRVLCFAHCLRSVDLAATKINTGVAAAAVEKG